MRGGDQQQSGMNPWRSCRRASPGCYARRKKGARRYFARKASLNQVRLEIFYGLGRLVGFEPTTSRTTIWRYYQLSYSRRVLLSLTAVDEIGMGTASQFRRSVVGNGRVRSSELEACLLYTSPSPRDRQKS